ncbi:MAG TPA: hypothetical protein V6D07_18580 [Trichocoleus sp.]
MSNLGNNLGRLKSPSPGNLELDAIALAFKQSPDGLITHEQLMQCVPESHLRNNMVRIEYIKQVCQGPDEPVKWALGEHARKDLFWATPSEFALEVQLQLDHIWDVAQMRLIPSFEAVASGRQPLEGNETVLEWSTIAAALDQIQQAINILDERFPRGSKEPDAGHGYFITGSR